MSKVKDYVEQLKQAEQNADRKARMHWLIESNKNEPLILYNLALYTRQAFEAKFLGSAQKPQHEYVDAGTAGALFELIDVFTVADVLEGVDELKKGAKNESH